MRWINPVAAFVPILAACVFAQPPPDEVSGDDAGIGSGPRRELSVTVRSLAGASGKVTADGIEIAPGTLLSRPDGSSVTLRSPDSTFQSFAVDCPGSACQRTTANTLTLSMTADHAVEVT